MFPRLTALAILVLLGVAPAVRADTVELKNGATFHGKIVEESDQKITIETGSGTLTFEPAQVRKVEHGQAAPPALEKPGPKSTGGTAKPNREGGAASRGIDELREMIRRCAGDSQVLEECLGEVAGAVPEERDRPPAMRKLIEESMDDFRAIWNRNQTAEGGMGIARQIEQHRDAYRGDPGSWFRDAAEMYLAVLRIDAHHTGAFAAIREMVHKHPALIAEFREGNPSPADGGKDRSPMPGFTGLPTDERFGGQVKLYRVADLDNEISSAFKQRSEEAKAGQEATKFRWKSTAEGAFAMGELPPATGEGVAELWMLRVTIDPDFYIETRGANGVVGREDIKKTQWVELRWDSDLTAWTFPTREMIRGWLKEQLAKAGGPWKDAIAKREATQGKVGGQGDDLKERYAAVEDGLKQQDPKAIMVPLRLIASLTSAVGEACRGLARSVAEVEAAHAAVDRLTRTFVRYGGTEADAAAAVENGASGK